MYAPSIYASATLHQVVIMEVTQLNIYIFIIFYLFIHISFLHFIFVSFQVIPLPTHSNSQPLLPSICTFTRLGVGLLALLAVHFLREGNVFFLFPPLIGNRWQMHAPTYILYVPHNFASTYRGRAPPLSPPLCDN